MDGCDAKTIKPLEKSSANTHKIQIESDAVATAPECLFLRIDFFFLLPINEVEKRHEGSLCGRKCARKQ